MTTGRKKVPSPQQQKVAADVRKSKARKLRLHFHLSPGDTLVGTAALECLHKQYPGDYLTDVSGTAAHAIFENNRWVTKLENPEVIKMEYPLIHRCNQKPVHFIEGYVKFLGEQLAVPLDCFTNRPHLYLSMEEKSWKGQIHEMLGKPVKYWVVCSGIKKDFTTKAWGTENYQKVIDHFRGVIQFVQIGEKGHNHPPLTNVIDLRGKTNTRELIRLCWHAQGGLGGVSFPHHIFAAFRKPFVTIASGMEPRQWESYPTGIMLSRHGCLPCCSLASCWKSRTVPLDDGSSKDKSLCELPTILGGENIPKCMALIQPEETCRAIESYYLGGVLSF